MRQPRRKAKRELLSHAQALNCDQQFAINIRFLRHRNRKLQAELAEMVNVDRRTWGAWEDRGITPNIDKLIEVSKVFGVTVDDLLSVDLKTILTDESIEIHYRSK